MAATSFSNWCVSRSSCFRPSTESRPSECYLNASRRRPTVFDGRRSISRSSFKDAPHPKHYQGPPGRRRRFARTEDGRDGYRTS